MERTKQQKEKKTYGRVNSRGKTKGEQVNDAWQRAHDNSAALGKESVDGSSSAQLNFSYHFTVARICTVQT